MVYVYKEHACAWPNAGGQKPEIMLCRMIVFMWHSLDLSVFGGLHLQLMYGTQAIVNNHASKRSYVKIPYATLSLSSYSSE